MFMAGGQEILQNYLRNLANLGELKEGDLRMPDEIRDYMQWPVLIREYLVDIQSLFQLDICFDNFDSRGVENKTELTSNDCYLFLC